jgi:TRAP-type C4-dicarboxylate transport system permease small subunit
MLEAFANKVAWVTKLFIGVFASVMAVTIISEVFSRYFFQYSIFFSEELSRLCFLWAGFLSMSIALKKGMHISIQFIVQRLPKALKRIVSLVSQFMVLIFLVVTFASGIRMLPHHWSDLATTIDITMFWFYLAVPTGVGLMVIQLLPLISRTIREDQ